MVAPSVTKRKKNRSLQQRGSVGKGNVVTSSKLSPHLANIDRQHLPSSSVESSVAGVSSDRKHGKYGPAVDCILCSLNTSILGMCLGSPTTADGVGKRMYFLTLSHKKNVNSGRSVIMKIVVQAICSSML